MTDTSNCDQSASGEKGRWPEMREQSVQFPPTMPGLRPWPKISIVTPSYNQGRFIEQTILSVANQGYPNVEHIICDGGSDDETLSILERHKGALSHIISEKDRGQSHAINKGMALASGAILTWLNSGDMLAPGALASIALAFAASKADMVAGICEIYKDGALVHRHLTACADGALPLDDLLDLDGGWNAGQFFFQPEVFFTRDIWERAGGQVDEHLHYSMDYDLWLRFAASGAQLHVIGRPVAMYRQHVGQKDPYRGEFQSRIGAPPARLPVDNGIRAEHGASGSGSQPFVAHSHAERPRLEVGRRHRAFSGGAGLPDGAAIPSRRLPLPKPTAIPSRQIMCWKGSPTSRPTSFSSATFTAPRWPRQRSERYRRAGRLSSSCTTFGG